MSKQEKVLEAFGVPAKVQNIVRGPKITRFELSVPLGVSVKRIPNYETDIAGIEIGEWSSIDELNELAEALEELDENDREVIEALLEAGYDLEEAMEKKDDCIVWTNCNDMSDVAYEYCQMSGMFENVPDFVERYFDYDAFGRDMDLEGYSHYIFTDCGNCVEIPR